MKRVVLFLVVILADAGAVAATPASDASSAPVTLTFEKSLVDPAGVWEGTVSGDIEGDLTTVLLEARQTDQILHVRFAWIIDAADDDFDFVAELDGILNLKTGEVVMNGSVVDGYLIGAEVHEEAQLVDSGTLRFVGTIRIMPATGDPALASC